MLSAGQYYPTQPTQQQGTGQTSQYYGPQPPQPYGGFQPAAMPYTGTTTSTGTIKFDGGELSDPQRTKFLDDQTSIAKTGLWMNTATSLANAITSWVGLAQQGEAMNSYYNYMNKVADNGMTVALEQLQMQEKGMDYAKILAEEQQDHEVKLARLGQALQVKLARVTEQGKTDRAGIYAANNAFSNYDYGSPSIS